MLAILTTHPIQYQIPIWRRLAQRGNVPVKVYYMTDQGLAAKYDPGFGARVAWDIDLLSGYRHEFLPNITVGPKQSSFWWLRLNSDLAARARRDGADILWIQGWQVAAYWQALWQAKAAGLETWLRAETNRRSTERGVLRFVKRPALGRFLNRIDRFLCVGQANRQFYLSRSAAPDRLFSAPYCIDNARFARQADQLRAQKSTIRRRWGIPDDAACVLFVGKLVAKKRPLDVVIASQLARKLLAGRPLHLLFVGTGELLGAVRESCAVRYDFEAGLTATPDGGPSGERIPASIVGFLNQSELSQAYVAADCLALPSDATETWGLVVNEALASGLPVVVSDAVGCSDDLVRPLRPDLCFPVGDHARFAGSLVSCLSNPPRRSDLEALADGHDVLRTVETVETLYRSSRSTR